MKSAYPQGRKERGKSGPGFLFFFYLSSILFLFPKNPRFLRFFPIVILFWATYDLTELAQESDISLGFRV